MNGVLEGIRVLDFGRYVAGPAGAALLADFGAEVIRVEHPSGYDDRTLFPLSETEGLSGASYSQTGRNKLSLTLDHMSKKGREILEQLVRSADVVMTSQPHAALNKQGLNYENLKAMRPDIIFTNVSAFGPTGPYKDRVGFDGVGQVMCGAAAMSGDPEIGPVKSAASWVDSSTALYAALGTMAALMERAKSGKGQSVDANLLGSAFSVTGAHLIEHAMTGIVRAGTRNRSQVTGPADIYRTKDGWILAQVVGPLFKRWTRLIKEDHWLTDPRFSDDRGRGEHNAVLNERMAQWCAERTSAEALVELDEARIPNSPVYNFQEAVNDEHVRAVGLMQPVDAPEFDKPVPVVRTPIDMSETPPTIRTAAPTLGAHTDEILSGLGYDTKAIAQLREAGTV